MSDFFLGCALFIIFTIFAMTMFVVIAGLF